MSTTPITNPTTPPISSSFTVSPGFATHPYKPGVARSIRSRRKRVRGNGLTDEPTWFSRTAFKGKKKNRRFG